MNILRLRRLISSLRDPQVSLVWNASRELALLGDAAQEALPVLTDLLRHPDPNTALWARYAIAKITGEITVHLPFFLNALGERDRYFPGMVATAIAGFGAEAREAIPRLLELLVAPEADNRWSAAWALGAMGNVAAVAVPQLVTALTDDPDEKTRWYAAYALSEMSKLALAPFADRLIFAIEHDFDDDVRGYALLALLKIAGSASLPLLETLRNDENPEIRERAIKGNVKKEEK